MDLFNVFPNSLVFKSGLVVKQFLGGRLERVLGFQDGFERFVFVEGQSVAGNLIRNNDNYIGELALS